MGKVFMPMIDSVEVTDESYAIIQTLRKEIGKKLSIPLPKYTTGHLKKDIRIAVEKRNKDKRAWCVLARIFVHADGSLAIRTITSHKGGRRRPFIEDSIPSLAQEIYDLHKDEIRKYGLIHQTV